MSWVFLAGQRVYKLKKAVRFPYLDFHSLSRREIACRAEYSLNRRLAPDVYIGIEPLVYSGAGLSIGGEGQIVDWLVVMRRLDDSCTLESAILEARVDVRQIDALVETLSRFFHHARPVLASRESLLLDQKRTNAYNRRVLLDPRLGLPQGLIRRIDAILRRHQRLLQRLVSTRIRQRRLVDGHGDLRPEHIWLNKEVRIIDCLEFNSRLRMIDPFDEIAYLTLECDRLGEARTAARIRNGFAQRCHNAIPPELFLLYRCHRAMLRARLAISHLLEPNPRTPQKWPRQANGYLRLAEKDALVIEQIVRKRRDRSVARQSRAGGLHPRAAKLI